MSYEQGSIEWVKANKSLLLMNKKSVIKYSDSVSLTMPIAESSEVIKEVGVGKMSGTMNTDGRIMVKSAMNTTNIMDSHDDVHIAGLWKKTLAENKNIIHLQEHKMTFDKVITDEVNAYTKAMTWASLGYDYEGSTQVLVFDSVVTDSRNKYMYDLYSAGQVKNHSVGMQYVKIELAINDKAKEYADEKAVWDKYIGEIANADYAKSKGYFFAVTEAKLIEGSAVVIGSNRATPTISVTEAGKATSDDNKSEPDNTTRIDWNKLAKANILLNN